MTEKKIATVDPGSKFGLAVFHWSNDGLLDLEFSLRQNSAQSYIKGLIEDFLCGVSKVYIEEQFIGPNPRTVIKMAWNKNVWQILLTHYGIETEMIMPSTWQSPLVKKYGLQELSSAAKKKKFADIARERFRLKKVSKDEADALCMGHYLEVVLGENNNEKDA